jgi:hypothetical protein
VIRLPTKFACSTFAALFFACSFAAAQYTVATEAKQDLFAPVPSDVSGADSPGDGFVRSVSELKQSDQSFGPFSHIGVSWHAGLGGVGFDIATPISRRFNLRTGFDDLGFAVSFHVQGVDVAANAQMRAGHASLDWFPFGGRFHVSPMLVFANNNQFKANGVVPGGKIISVDGTSFESSPTDPLHGNGLVTFRRVSPGLTAGFGNMIPRTNRHISFPLEAGFYYAGPPRLNIVFSGSACDPQYVTKYGAAACGSVSQSPEFQQSVQSFINRDEQKLRYASFFPVFSFGMAYSF